MGHEKSWHEARFEVKMVKAPHVRTVFEVEMMEKRTAVARSTIRSQNVQNLEVEMFKKGERPHIRPLYRGLTLGPAPIQTTNLNIRPGPEQNKQPL